MKTITCDPADQALLMNFAAALAFLRTQDTLQFEASMNAADPVAQAFIEGEPDGMAQISGGKAMAHATALLAECFGIVVTIEQAPRYPLAMGNSEHVVNVRPRRVMAA